jgi:LPPG:FO 2-phospho-L-lactate transferase
MLRGLAALEEVELTAVVNTGDDEWIYGLHVSPDIDTVIYTLAGQEGPQGWGRADDSHRVIEALEMFPIDTWFRIGDGDLATNLFRTARLQAGWTLSQVTTAQAAVFGVETTVLPATDDALRTEVHLEGEGWLSFQSYFVERQHRGRVDDVRFAGAWAAAPGPGVVDAIRSADLVVIGPSNPPLSIWPILAVDGIAVAVAACPRVVAVSPLIGGRAVKGPADRVMEGLGLAPGTDGVLDSYPGLLHELVVDTNDASGPRASGDGVALRALPIDIRDPEAAVALAEQLVRPG